MRDSLHAQLSQALEAYSEPHRSEWVLNWAGQLVIAGCQSVWSANTDRAIAAGALKDGCVLSGELVERGAMGICENQTADLYKCTGVA